MLSDWQSFISHLFEAVYIDWVRSGSGRDMIFTHEVPRSMLKARVGHRQGNRVLKGYLKYNGVGQEYA